MNLDSGTEYISSAGQQDKADLQVSQTFSDDPSKSSDHPTTAFDPKLENSTVTSGQRTNNPGNRSRCGSKTSIPGKQRDGSISSNRRSIQGQPLSAEPVLQSTTTTPPAVAKSEKKRKGGISRLLSKLSCCGVPEDANAIDLDEQAIPARKTSKPIPSQARQTTPTSKPNISAAESSTTGSKEPNEEKIGGPPYSSLKSAGEPKIQEQPKPTAPKATPTSQPTLFRNVKDQDATRIAPVITSQKSFSPPMEVPSQDMPMDIPQQTDPVPQGASVIVVPPTPLVPIPAERQNAINVQTPLQDAGDSDTEMTDAPPIEPVIDDMQKNVEPSEAETVPPLPPPPPIVPRMESSAPGHDRNPTNNLPIHNEQQKWLLPPIKPELRGKKCLVLDLDETLVHSSFKVGAVFFDHLITRLTIVDTPSS